MLFEQRPMFIDDAGPRPGVVTKLQPVTTKPIAVTPWVTFSFDFHLKVFILVMWVIGQGSLVQRFTFLPRLHTMLSLANEKALHRCLS